MILHFNLAVTRGNFFRTIYLVFDVVLFFLGYVLSREALNRFTNIALVGKTKKGTCKIDDDRGNEDAEIGRCLESVNIHAGDSRDTEGKERFFPLSPESVILPQNIPPWYWKYKYYESANAHKRSANVSFLPYINSICLREII